MSVAVVAWLAAVSLDKGSEGLCVLNYAEEMSRRTICLESQRHALHYLGNLAIIV